MKQIRVPGTTSHAVTAVPSQVTSVGSVNSVHLFSEYSVYLLGG